MIGTFRARFPFVELTKARSVWGTWADTVRQGAEARHQVGYTEADPVILEDGEYSDALDLGTELDRRRRFARAGPAHTPRRVAGQSELGVRQDFAHHDALLIERHARRVWRALQEVREALGSLLGFEQDQRDALIRGARHPVASDKAGQVGDLRHDLIETSLGRGPVGDGNRMGNCVHDAPPHL